MASSDDLGCPDQILQCKRSVENTLPQTYMLSKSPVLIGLRDLIKNHMFDPYSIDCSLFFSFFQLGIQIGLDTDLNFTKKNSHCQSTALSKMCKLLCPNRAARF